ncbi:hypothetical protein FM036_27600 [Nostoc sp. HG1]|nr:hypothetical protein [Nostoc sp. HG1]
MQSTFFTELTANEEANLSGGTYGYTYSPTYISDVNVGGNGQGGNSALGNGGNGYGAPGKVVIKKGWGW